MLSGGQFGSAGKFFASATITSASVNAGEVTVEFRVMDPRNNPPTPVTTLTAVGANIAKLAPPSNGDAFSKWVPYIWRTETVSGSATGNWPNPDGTVRYQGTRENNGTLTNNGDGTYKYVFSTNISNITVGGNAITYEPNRKHRVAVMMGGASGPTADAVFDFVPDGSAVSEGRDIVSTDACKACHGPEFHGHGGDRISTQVCATCHAPGGFDANGGESIDLKVMIHRIHMGGELERIAGADGVVWDNPATPAVETADNGEYAIWGYRNTKFTWWKASYPAIIENCTKCHQGTGAQVDNWKNVPSRDACGSCHEAIDWTTGANHTGGPQPNDNNCGTCHPPAGLISPPIIYPVTAAHDWTVTDQRNIPEFGLDIQLSAPANGQFYVNGEAPIVTVVIKENDVPIDHTTITQDATAEGCVEGSPCPARDGAFTNAALLVHGPRAKSVPVLTTKARAFIGGGVGPFDLSTSGANLVLKVDAGKNLVVYDVSGGDKIVLGTITVPVVAAAFADVAAATPAEVVAWLNANTAFSARAIAYLLNGAPAIRSRNLGDVFSIQLQPSVVATAVFNNDTTVKALGNSTAANQLYQASNPTNTDPKITFTTASIQYQLDPVDDLIPGTYVVNLEITDRGRKSATDYKTPSVAKRTFQVKQAAEEKPVAGNCDQCHQTSDGRGFILDYSRHYKVFDQTATDQCTACHDYQPQNATGLAWSGAKPISRRVHGVHFGSSLNFPLQTVDYINGDPVVGRNWNITFPMDVRYCDASCHTTETSGTWKTNASRLPCSGCHDSDASMAHMRLMTWDLTPADPWSGDEEESCMACH